MNFLINLALFISVALVCFYCGRNVFPKKTKEKPIGKILVIKDDVDKEIYFTLEVSCSQLNSLPDGPVPVLMQIEHRNFNTPSSEEK